MKIYLYLICLFISSSLFAQKIEEAVFVLSNDPSDLRKIQSHPDLIIDHKTPFGFELYGPKGLQKYLDFAEIEYMETHIHKHYDISGYPSFFQVEKNLKEYVALNPSIAKLISIGKSVEGRDLWVVKISDNVEIDEKEPEFKYISSMHGDEITGRELTQLLIKDMISNYGKDKELTDLINNTEIYIMPSMNPDGSEYRQRANANGYDLNRNFPDWVKGDSNSSVGRQPETKAIMKFQESRNFSLSANFHGGAVVVNYPWDNTYDKHPLDTFVQKLSLIYANENPQMRNSREFNQGITNGADWYVLRGGMQDWSYFFYNDLQVTVELSDKKWPRYSEIKYFYKDNKASMIKYMQAIHQGIGINTTIDEGYVKIYKNSIYMGRFGFSRGEFYKVLPKGNYTLEVYKRNHTKIKTLSYDLQDSRFKPFLETL